MLCLKIFHRREGEEVLDGILYEDGRFDGDPGLEVIVRGLPRLVDPVTRQRDPTSGEPLLRAVGARLTNGYSYCRIESCR